MIRGLRSVDPRALELMRSYAASRSAIYWKLRLPASLAVPVHRPEDRGHGEHRRGDHRRGHRRHPGRAGARDHDVQLVLHHRAGEAVGIDPRGRPRSGSRSTPASCWSIERVRGRSPIRARVARPCIGRDDARRPWSGPGARRHRPSGSAVRSRGRSTRGRRAHDHGPQGHRPRHRARRVRLADRAVRLREVDAPAHRRRPHRARRPARCWSTASPPSGARRDRDYGMVFQAPVLFEWRTVEDNVKLPLEVMGYDAADADRAGQGDARPGRARRSSAATARGSCRAGCSNGSRSRARSRSSRRSCSWTSRSARSMR